MSRKGLKILVDQSIPTIDQIINRRPDMVMHMKKEKRMVILEVACSLDHLVEEREKP